jgi:hypothetical protein
MKNRTHEPRRGRRLVFGRDLMPILLCKGFNDLDMIFIPSTR